MLSRSRAPKDRNDIRLVTSIGSNTYAANFKLSEFENSEGLAMVNPTVLRSLECVRAELNRRHRGGVSIIITDAVRTETDLQKLASKYGWIDEGGSVSRDSKHLTKFGGIAVDIKAHRMDNGYSTPIPQEELGEVCRVFFDWVKDDYPDGHVHADNRNGGLRKP